MMKKIFLILFLCLIATLVSAQHGSQHGFQNGTITVSSNNNQKFWLFVDDVLQNEYSTNLIRLQGLQFTYYKIRVEMDNQVNNCVGETVLISNMPNSNNYVVTREKGNLYSFKRTQTVFNPFFIQTLILPNYNYYSSYEQYLFPGFNPNANYGQGNQFKGNVYKKYQYNQGYGQGYGGNQGYGSGHGSNSGQGYGNPPGHGNPPPPLPPPTQGGCMNPGDFSRAISVIQNESFENSKFDIAKQMTSNNRLCVSQIIQICRLFNFENTKLDFAKFAYRFCLDQNNYYQVNEVFTYSSSKDELRQYIGY